MLRARMQDQLRNQKGERSVTCITFPIEEQLKEK